MGNIGRVARGQVQAAKGEVLALNVQVFVISAWPYQDGVATDGGINGILYGCIHARAILFHGDGLRRGHGGHQNNMHAKKVFHDCLLLSFRQQPLFRGCRRKPVP
ncbi:MAG: hypothetical protein KKD74_06550 [Bacteroidetes bacterium]|nr:hypothetical protein [Bacteroidota bacterium]